MDKTAIQQIQESANIPEIIKQIDNNVLAIPVAAIPNSISIKSLEEYMPNAAFYRMNYKTNSLRDFIGYNKENDADGALCFIDDEKMQAATTFDLVVDCNPGHKKHTARVSLERTAALRALLAIVEERLSQKDASEFFEDWASCITVFKKDGEKLELVQAVQSLRNMTIESAKEINSQINDFSESMSSMERVEAKNKDQLPAEFYFKCTPYNGLDSREFQVRISILTGGDKPAIKFRIIQYEEVIEDMVDEFRDILEEEFEPLEIKTYVGTV